ncbi:MAG: ATP-binding protein [Ignavibacteriaceae bacterium]|jgi:PAS domain S-box-containing protein|nr:ATP-binding protein [Ignavibacteriaceae bacterium]
MTKKAIEKYTEENISLDEQTIRQLFEDYIRMYAGRDDILTTYFSDNFSGFTGGGNFLVKDKKEWIAITRQDFDQVKKSLRIEMKDLSIQALSDNIAVTTGFFTIHLPIRDHILSRETARLVLIFRKESNDWKITHSSISIPYYLVKDGEVYPMKELVERNQYLEKLVAQRTIQLSEINERLQKTNEELNKEIIKFTIAEEALQNSSQKWEALIAASPDGVGMISLDGKMLLISDKLAEIYGYAKHERDEIIGRPALDFIDPSDHKRLTENLYQLISGKRGNQLSEYLAIRKDNSRINIDINTTLLLDSNGKPTSVLFVERDITKRKKVEQETIRKNLELAELNATKDKFFSIIAHDLKSPFQGLISFSQILSTQFSELSEDEKISFISSIEALSQSSYRLLENLLDWSRLQTGQMTYNPEPLNLLIELFPTITLIKQTALNKNIAFDYSIDSSIVAKADINMLSTIIRNLLSNAIKFTNSGGKITLLVKVLEDSIEFSVTDTGIGIEKENLDNLFRIGNKESRRGTANETGTGIGLFLCKEMIDRHGGNLKVESQISKGTTFSFTIPN